MIRTQIQLTNEQASAVKELARRQGVSMAEVIRQAVEGVVAEHDAGEKWQRASALVGRYHIGPSDVAVRHDDYLAEDYQ